MREENQDPNLTLWHCHTKSAAVSPPFTVAAFDRAVLSWNATGAGRYEIEVGGTWHPMGSWGQRPAGVTTEFVDVDTLVLKTPAKSFRIRVIPEEGSHVAMAAVAHWMNGERKEFSATRSEAWGKTLPVPERSQMVEKTDSGQICSPTSLSMVLAFYGVNKTVREVADGVFDHASKLYGNWPLNTAYASALGCPSYVARASGLDALEAQLAQGRPVVISHLWNEGELTGAPIPSSSGHLIVVVGFTDTGDLVVNDPAARPGSVRRTYKRREIYHTWLENGPGIMYIVAPR